MEGHVLALAGGVGGAKLVRGLSQVLAPEQLTVVVNTADDFEHLGLSVSPDLDSVMYALAGLNDTERGWGLTGETWRFMHALGRLDAPTWFSLGDQDLATHVVRTEMLRNGATLSEVTQHLAKVLGIEHPVFPMSDQAVRTMVQTTDGPLEFQRYFVQHQCAPEVTGFQFVGAAEAKASPGLAAALTRADLSAVIICPSNPFISIDPMLAIADVRSALLNTSAPCVAVTPIVGGNAIKGPAAKMLSELGLSQSAEGIVEHYGDLLDGFLADEQDRHSLSVDGALDLEFGNTLMKSDEDRQRVARAALAQAQRLATL